MDYHGEGTIPRMQKYQMPDSHWIQSQRDGKPACYDASHFQWILCGKRFLTCAQKNARGSVWTLVVTVGHQVAI